MAVRTTPGGDLADDFHTYSVDWAADSIAWLFDGAEFSRLTRHDVTRARAPFTQQFYLLINLAVGGEWSGNATLPASMLVDWIRIYENEAGESTLDCQALQ